MRWPIATDSRMRSGAFQIHDELVRTSLYKGLPHLLPPPLAGEGKGGGAIKLKGRALEHGGTVRAALTTPTDSTQSVTHNLPETGANPRVVWLLVASVALGLGLAIVWSPSF